MLPFEPTLSVTIKTIDEAKSFIQMLQDNGLMFHFEDDPREVINIYDNLPFFTPEQCEQMDLRISELYSFDWGIYDCPLGYYLDVVNPVSF